VANVAPQYDPSPSTTPDPNAPVIGAPVKALPTRGRYAHIYDEALKHRGDWLPVTFLTPAAARSMANAAIQLRTAMNQPEAVGPIGLERLEVKVRQMTVYLRVPGVVSRVVSR
jgi:hypothetical protein